MHLKGGYTAPTRREIEVLELHSHGLTYRSIAVHLAISEATVNTHFANLREKMRSRSNIQAFRKLIEQGRLVIQRGKPKV